jgi:hypothetical protein
MPAWSFTPIVLTSPLEPLEANRHAVRRVVATEEHAIAAAAGGQVTRRHEAATAQFQRRARDSNPEVPFGTPVFKTGAIAILPTLLRTQARSRHELHEQ